MKPQLFVIRGRDGYVEAIHQRTDRGPKEKGFAWWTLDHNGKPWPGLQGRRVESLPLYGTQHARWWDQSSPVYLVEGEKAALALAQAGQRSLGCLGSSSPPSDSSLAVLAGLDVILWPDHDASGRRLMRSVAARIAAAAASLRWAEWPEAPAGGDAADFLAAGLRLETLKLGHVPDEPKVIPLAGRRATVRASLSGSSPIARFNDAVAVSDVLRRDYGIERATAGRSVNCPFHDDRSPSLSILPDDRRVYCHAPCWANNDGRGRDAWDLAQAAPQQVAR